MHDGVALTNSPSLPKGGHHLKCALLRLNKYPVNVLKQNNGAVPQKWAAPAGMRRIREASFLGLLRFELRAKQAEVNLSIASTITFENVQRVGTRCRIR